MLMKKTLLKEIKSHFSDIYVLNVILMTLGYKNILFFFKKQILYFIDDYSYYYSLVEIFF